MRTQLLAVISALALAGCASHSDRPVVSQTSYNKPLYSSGAQFGALPPAVQNTVRAEAGSEEVSDIIKDSSSGQTVYKILFENRGILPPLYVARDGSVLNPDLTVAIAAPHELGSAIGSSLGTPIKLTDLPSPVLDVIHQQASRSDISSVDKTTWGNRTVYVVTFKDDSHYPKLYVEADGTLLKDVK